MHHFKLIPLEERIVFDGAAAAHILYVNASAHSGGNGLSWGSAFNDLQTAINTADHLTGSTQIWVAKGTYTPDAVPANPSSATFLINDSYPLAIYGGFTVGATSLSQSNPSANPTILNGVLSGGGNVDTIVTINEGIITLNGLTISGADNTIGSGGGVLVNNATLTVSNDTFTNDMTGTALGDWGGAIASFNSNLTITNSTFVGNSASDGGAISDAGDPTLTITSSLFKNNTAFITQNNEQFNTATFEGGLGGAVFALTPGFLSSNSYANNINISSSIFDNNSVIAVSSNLVGGAGGAISLFGIQNLNVNYNLFSNNSADVEGASGGAAQVDAINIKFSFDNFSNNSALYGGGAISGGGIADILENLYISYCVFNNNSALGTSAFDGASGQGATGGALDIEPLMGIVIIDHTIFNQNKAYYAGGAFDIGNNSQSLTVTSSIFTNNSVVAQGGLGGAIWDNTAVDFGYTQATANIVITGNLFVGNQASSGNDLWFDGTETTINGLPTTTPAGIISALSSSNLLLDPDAVVIL